MRVTKKLVATTCLPIYQKVLKEGKKDNFNVFMKRLESYHAEKGICLLFSSNTNELCHKFFEKAAKVDAWGYKDGKYLCKVPEYANSKKEAVELIKKRIEFLEKWNK